MRRVLELSAFRRLLAVTMLNELALTIGAVALAVLVYRRTGSALGATAFFLCAEFGPGLLSPLLVARLDQKSIRRTLTLLYATDALSFVALLFLVHRFALALVLILVLLSGSLAATAGVLVRTAWTSVTSGSDLLRDASALVNAGYSICFMAGPALGGVLVALGGTVAALAVNVGAYVLAMLIVATASDLPGRSQSDLVGGPRLRSAMRYARREPLIRSLLSLQAIALLFFTLATPVEVVFAQRTLHAGAGGYGVLLGAWGAGAIIGSGIYARWRHLPSRVLMTLGTGLLGSGFLLMAVAPILSVAVAGATIAGIGNGVQVVAMRTALQEAVAEQWMALVLSLNQALFQALPGLGIAIGGALAASAGPRIAFGAGAVGSLAVALAMWIKLPTPEASRAYEESPIAASSER